MLRLRRPQHLPHHFTQVLGVRLRVGWGEETEGLMVSPVGTGQGLGQSYRLVGLRSITPLGTLPFG